MRLIADCFLEQAKRQPDQLALVIANRQTEISLTYQELRDRALSVATAVQQLPRSHPQPWVGMVLPNGLDFVETFLGTAIAGGVAVVYEPRWAAEQLRQVIAAHPPDIIVASTDCLSALNEIAVKKTERLSNGRPTIFPKPQITEMDPFYIGFTSGTTALPKGVIRHHRSWVQSIAASQIEFAFTTADHILIPGPLTHSLTLFSTLEALNIGAAAHLLSQFDSRTALAQLQQHPITRLVLVPLMLNAILKTAQRKSLTFPEVKTIVTAGAKLEPELRDRIPLTFPQAEVLEYYGALELSFVSLHSSRENAPARSVGRPFHNVQVSVRRDDGSGPTNIGELGWIGVRSESICLGYLGGGDGSGLRIIDGWATVGDRGWQDANGFLHLIGREQDMIVTGGVNVYPSEIESVLHEWPEIEEATVLGLPDVERGEIVAAVISWKNQRLSRAEILKKLQLSLPAYKCPRQIFTTPTFPRTPSGKVIRPELRQWILNQHSISPII